MQELNPYNGVTPTLHRPVFIFHKKNIYMDLYNVFCIRFKVSLKFFICQKQYFDDIEVQLYYGCTVDKILNI